MALGSTQPLTEMSTRSISWGLRRPVRKADNLTPSCAVVTKSGSLNFLEQSGSVQACNGTALPFTRINGLLMYAGLILILTPWCRVLLEKLTGLRLVKKLPAFHGTRRFITALTSVRHLSLSWASQIQSIYTYSTSWRSILILSAHLRLGLPGGLLPPGFPTKTLYTPLSSPIRATCPAHLI